MGAANILVTGASRGIGAAIALELAARGHRVGCLSRAGRGPEDVEVPADLRERLVHLRADLSDAPSVAAAFREFEARAGALGGLVNNAGVHIEGRAADQPMADFEAVIALNVTATFMVCQQAYPGLKRAGGGLIVNIGSFFDKLGVKRNAAYCASKAAVAAIGRCLAVEWAADGIRAVTVAPGFIVTDLNREAFSTSKLSSYLASRIPTGGPAMPDEVARMVAMLYETRLSFLTGETLYLDGGQSIAG